MIRHGALLLGLSLLAVWAIGYTPTAVDVYLRPVAAGLLTIGIALLVMARERPCPTCLAVARLDAMDRHPAGRREPLDTLVVEDEHETSTPPGVPIVDERGRELDADEAEQLLDELDPIVDTDPGVRVPPYAWTAQDPATTAPIPVVRP